MNNYIEFKLHDDKSNIVRRNLHKNKITTDLKNDYVFNNKHYDIFACIETNKYVTKDNINIYVNGTYIHCKKNIEFQSGKYNIIFQDFNDIGLRLFGLVYDIATVVIEITGNDREEFISEEVICLSNLLMDARNLEHIVSSILHENDARINKALFSHSKANHVAYGDLGISSDNKNIDSFIRYAKDVVNIYKQNYVKFKAKAKHAVTTKNEVTKADKVSIISQENLKWLLNNLDVLYEVADSGISIGGKNYIPYEMSSVQYKRNYAIYENQIILGLLKKLSNQICNLIDELNTFRNKEQSILKSLENISAEYYVYTVLTIKKKYLETIDYQLDILLELKNQIGLLYKKYALLFNCKGILFDTIPKRTKVFSELVHYKKVYNLIINYEKYSSVDFDREKIISSIRSMDRLYEYYCLIKLLKVLLDAGFTFPNEDRMSKNYIYKLDHLRYSPDELIANTYYLENDEYYITVYYEPVIYNYPTNTTNGIELYRTTDSNPNYYCPDFIISISSKNKDLTNYYILDAKYSNRFNLRKHDTLFNTIKKYHLELATTGENVKLKMIWLLQGKVDKEHWDIEYYHNSQMARKYHPEPICGIFNLNFEQSNMDILFSEILKHN